MPAWELERDNSDEDFENDEREERGPIEDEEGYEQQHTNWLENANRDFSKYDPNTPLHF